MFISWGGPLMAPMSSSRPARRPLRIVVAVLLLAGLGAVGALVASTVAASRPVDLGPGVVMQDDAAGSAPATAAIVPSSESSPSTT